MQRNSVSLYDTKINRLQLARGVVCRGRDPQKMVLINCKGIHMANGLDVGYRIERR